MQTIQTMQINHRLFRQNTLLVLAFFYLLSYTLSAQANELHFSVNDIAQWQVEEFSGATQYQVQQLNEIEVLKAISQKSASGLVKEQRIDLFATPYLNWQWRTEQKLTHVNERDKAGDDFVARVYVVIDGGIKFWQTQSLTYVWSSQQDQGSVWRNPFAEKNVAMLAVRGKTAELNQWYSERRSVYQDLIEVFGDCGSDKANEKAYRYIDAIAIMTDTDNSGGTATSYYGDIRFSE